MYITLFEQSSSSQTGTKWSDMPSWSDKETVNNYTPTNLESLIDLQNKWMKSNIIHIKQQRDIFFALQKLVVQT